MELRRGDTGKWKFQRKDANGDVITTIADKLFFTIKKNDKTKDVVIMKKLEDMTFDNDGTYHITIKPEDTNGLDYGDYRYDIEVTQAEQVTTIDFGVFKLKPEITFKCNKE